MFEYLKSLILGIIEGITEWLPISSTGHMILFNELVDNSGSFLESQLYLYVIQLGAILAVVTLFFNKLNPFSNISLVFIPTKFSDTPINEIVP